MARSKRFTASALASLDASTRDALVALARERAVEDVESALVVERGEPHARLLAGEAFDALSGLAPGAGLGPVLHEGLPRWFDLFRPAQRLVVQVDGSAQPFLVLTEARLAVAPVRRRTILLEPGTVWLRADAVGTGHPPGSYVGINHRGGTVALGQLGEVAGDVITVTAPFHPVITLDLAPDEVAPGPDGCSAAGAAVELPPSLRLTVDAAGVSVTSDGGTAAAWGSSTTFAGPVDGAPWTFLPRLWTTVVRYDLAPGSSGPVAIDDQLVRAAGPGTVRCGGLSLPVVQPGDPAVLGAAARGPEWLLGLPGLRAAWYDDPRPHDLGLAHLSVSNRGTVLAADEVQPLVPPVRHDYDLWQTADGGGRLPWRTRYDEPFWLLSRCDAVDGAR